MTRRTRVNWCYGSGHTFPRGTAYPRVFEEVRELVFRGAGDVVKVQRPVRVAACPDCGRVVRVRAHMFSIAYDMLAQHKAPKK